MNLTKLRKQYMENYGDKQLQLDGWFRNSTKIIPIYTRKPADDFKSTYHTNIHISFPQIITDLKVGYMGKNIEIYSENQQLQALLDDFHRRNNIRAKMSDTLKKSIIQGLSHRLLYNKNGRPYVKNLPGYQVQYQVVAGEIVKAMHYYEEVDENNFVKFYCDVYDDIYKTRYIGSSYIEIDSYVVGQYPEDMEYRALDDPEEHLMGLVPIIPFYNNEGKTGDYQYALDTIDAYDTVLSDMVSEIKSIRGNYLVIAGDLAVPTRRIKSTDEDGNQIIKEVPSMSKSEYMKQNNAFFFPTDPETGKAMGDVKVINIEIPSNVQEYLDTLRYHIFEECKSVDIKMLQTNKDIRVFAIKTALMPLENNCQTTENYFTEALQRQYEIVLQYFINSGKIRGVDITDVEFKFTRNFPKDIQQQVQTATQAAAIMSVEDALRIAEIDGAAEIAERAEGELFNP